MKISLRRRHALTVADGAFSHKIDYVTIFKEILYPEEHQNRITCSKVTAISLNGWILPIGGASLGRVCACSLRSRLVYRRKLLKCWLTQGTSVLLVIVLLSSSAPDSAPIADHLWARDCGSEGRKSPDMEFGTDFTQIKL